MMHCMNGPLARWSSIPRKGRCSGHCPLISLKRMPLDIMNSLGRWHDYVRRVGAHHEAQRDDRNAQRQDAAEDAAKDGEGEGDGLVGGQRLILKVQIAIATWHGQVRLPVTFSLARRLRRVSFP